MKKSKVTKTHFSQLKYDAGDVEHSISVFNKMMNTGNSENSAVALDTVLENKNQEEVRRMDELIELKYDNLDIEVFKKTSPYSEPDYQPSYEMCVSHEYLVPKQDIMDFIFENVTDNDVPNFDEISDDELYSYINDHFDELFEKYKNMIMNFYRDSATKEAQEMAQDEEINGEYYPEYYPDDYREDFSRRDIDKDSRMKLESLGTIYKKYARVNDKNHMNRIIQKAKAVVESCSYIKNEKMDESYDSDLVDKLVRMWFSEEQAEWLVKNRKSEAEWLAYGNSRTQDFIDVEEMINRKMNMNEDWKSVEDDPWLNYLWTICDDIDNLEDIDYSSDNTKDIIFTFGNSGNLSVRVDALMDVLERNDLEGNINVTNGSNVIVVHFFDHYKQEDPDIVESKENAYSYKDYYMIDTGYSWKVKKADGEWLKGSFDTSSDAEEYVDSLE